MASSIDDTHDTAKLVRKLRLEKKLSQKQLADQAGVSFSFVNQLEGGKQTVRLDALNKILKVFGYAMAPQEKVHLGNHPKSTSQGFATADEPALDATSTSPFPVRQKNDWAFFS